MHGNPLQTKRARWNGRELHDWTNHGESMLLIFALMELFTMPGLIGKLGKYTVENVHTMAAARNASSSIYSTSRALTQLFSIAARPPLAFVSTT